MFDLERLTSFSILSSLTETGLEKVAEVMTIHSLNRGEILFRKGESDNYVHFLLEGHIGLRSDESSKPIAIEAGTDAAENPISRLKPRRYTAIAETASTVIAIDEDSLDNLLTADQTSAYVVTEIEGEDPEWMFKLFTHPAFKKVPTDNLASLFSRMQPLEARDGQVIIRQGDKGDYFYLIRRGKAVVDRSFNDHETTKVAELGVGDGFGEEALISGDPRNATVTSVGDTLLMRLSQDDFSALLGSALVKRITPGQAASLIGQGAKFLDVRTESEYRDHRLPSSINMPLAILRSLAKNLDPKRTYITVCQTGRRASTAAFILNQGGYTVLVLQGGLDAIQRAI